MSIFEFMLLRNCRLEFYHKSQVWIEIFDFEASFRMKKLLIFVLVKGAQYSVNCENFYYFWLVSIFKIKFVR